MAAKVLLLETQSLQVFEATKPPEFLIPILDPGRRIFFVDTPGFDGQDVSEVEVLRQLAEWLGATYSSSTRLSGVIYLQDIQQTRLSGSLTRGLLILRSMYDLRGIVLVLSKWDLVPENLAFRRRQEILRNRSFSFLTRDGRPNFTYGGTSSDAEAVVTYLVKLNERHTLAIQEEMVDRGMSLGETAAGLAVGDGNNQTLASAQSSLDNDESQKKAADKEQLKKKSDAMAQELANWRPFEDRSG